MDLHDRVVNNRLWSTWPLQKVVQLGLKLSKFCVPPAGPKIPFKFHYHQQQDRRGSQENNFGL